MWPDDLMTSLRLCCESEYDGPHEEGCGYVALDVACPGCGKYVPILAVDTLGGTCLRCGADVRNPAKPYPLVDAPVTEEEIANDH
jgi:hypothetical protein